MATSVKEIISRIVCIQLSLLSLTYASPSAEENKRPIKEVMTASFFSKNLAINTVESYKYIPQDGEVLFAKKLVIQPVEFKPNPSLEPTDVIAIPKVPEFGKPIWTITAQQLPVTSDMCLEEEAVTECDEQKNDLYHGGCYKPCMTYGPQFVAFDAKTGKLYLTVESTDFGTAGGTNFTFVADINKKEIKFIHTDHGPLDGDISPSGKYLLIMSMSQIKIYNTQTNDSFMIHKKNIFGPPVSELHYLYNIKWLSDTQFSYEDHVTHDKFQKGDDADGITEYTVDIPSQKTLSSRVIKANTYRYKPEDSA